MHIINFATKKLRTGRRSIGGDTIIEVLIAIAIAAFAIGTAYAIANRSLQRAITARERNEALNHIQSQISALKFRQRTDPSNFNAGFAVPASFGGTGTALHFCLNSANAPTDLTWPRVNNNFTNDAQPNTLVVGNPGYSPGCKFASSDTDYYVDISAQVNAASQSSINRTVYKVTVRWAAVGTGQPQQSVVYYRF